MTVAAFVHNGRLEVALRGSDAVFALRRRVSYPLASVDEVRVLPREQLSQQRGSVRVRGTNLSSGLTAGIYRAARASRDTQLWCVHGGTPLLVIDLTERWLSRIVLEVAEPETVARRIRQQRWPV